jgi:dienelactone hydrolase
VAAVLAAAAALTACTGGGGGGVVASMTVSPASALADVPVAVTVTGLPAGARTTVTATATDTAGVPWTSSADFAAGPDGRVSLGQKPLSGYPDADPMALFELMTPARGSAIFFAGGRTLDVTLRASVAGKAVAQATAHRRGPTDVGVRGHDLRPAAGGLYGTLDLPADTSVRRPALVVFGGSEGGLSPIVTNAAAVLAAQGYPALALAYFGEPGLPARLANVPLEYFARALRLLRAQPGVDPEHVLVQGTSRGGEAALLVGATYPDLVDGVVAGVPSSRVNPTPFDPTTPAWTLHGRPLTAGAEIPVERIRGPVLMNCGDQDGIWPSCLFLDAVRTRLTEHHFSHPVTALRYPEGGHYVGSFATSYVSWTPAALDVQANGSSPGGTLPATLAGAADSHAKLLALLRGLSPR